MGCFEDQVADSLTLFAPLDWLHLLFEVLLTALFNVET